MGVGSSHTKNWRGMPAHLECRSVGTWWQSSRGSHSPQLAKMMIIKMIEIIKLHHDDADHHEETYVVEKNAR